MDKLETLEFCLNYMRENPPLVECGESGFCKYCYGESTIPHDKSCKYNNSLLTLNVLIDELEKAEL